MMVMVSCLVAVLLDQSLGAANTQYLGIAYGTIHSSENVVLFILGVSMGALKDSTNSYHVPLWIVAGVATVGLIAAVVVRWQGPTPSIAVTIDDHLVLRDSADDAVDDGNVYDGVELQCLDST